VGIAAAAFGAGVRVGRMLALPARLLPRSLLLAPLATRGREAEARARERAETVAAEILAAPTTARMVDRALAGPAPAALPDETIERLARRVIESPTFERVIREAAGSRVAHELIDDVLHSAELERAVEDVLSGPVRTALRRETRSLGDDVTEALRTAMARLDERIERAARRMTRRRERSAVAQAETARHGGLASRASGLVADAGITHLGVLVVVSLVGVVGWLLGVTPPGWLVGVLAGAGWALLVGGYYVLFWSTAGQTPGMRLVGLRVLGPGGGPPGVGRSLLRLVASAVAVAPLGAGLVPVLFDARRRALQDYVARTSVARVSAPPAP
jgi:uncharacterized RDD family membrane protein YckC